MAEICFGVVGESDSSSAACETSSRATRRRRMELKRFQFVAPSENDVDVEDVKVPQKHEDLPARDCKNATESRCTDGANRSAEGENGRSEVKESSFPEESSDLKPITDVNPADRALARLNRFGYPKFGVASVCGRRRDMEDAVATHPSFLKRGDDLAGELHYFGLYDGHGCSHVATRCSVRLHELVKEELEREVEESKMDWRGLMERSFLRMDGEVSAYNKTVVGASCRCELQSPECDAVGSTAVVAVLTPDKIVVANCGDSRAVLCRNGKSVPLSSDHKPDRPDELHRIQEAGGRVIYWDGPRVLGVLAMSRAIGDNYLKPYVSSEPEVMVVDRSAEDECLILATDGLWDVVSNDTACGVARMCLRGKLNAPLEPTGAVDGDSSSPLPTPASPGAETLDKACSDASMLLTKLALARCSTDNVSIIVVDLAKRDT